MRTVNDNGTTSLCGFPPEDPEITEAKIAEQRWRSHHPGCSGWSNKGSSGLAVGLEGFFLAIIALIWLIIAAVVVTVFWSVAFMVLIHAGIPLGIALIILFLAANQR